MDPTQQQLANRLNPTPFNVSLPGEGQVFSAIGDDLGSNLYVRQGSSIQNLNLQELGQRLTNEKLSSLGLVPGQSYAAWDPNGAANYTPTAQLKALQSAGLTPSINQSAGTFSAGVTGSDYLKLAKAFLQSQGIASSGSYNLGDLGSVYGQPTKYTGTDYSPFKSAVTAGGGTKTLNTPPPPGTPGTVPVPQGTPIQNAVGSSTNPIAMTREEFLANQNSGATPTGISQVNGATTPNVPAQTYTIQGGDTLSKLAQTYGTTVGALMSLNPQITDANKIYTGQKINLNTPQTSTQTTGGLKPTDQAPDAMVQQAQAIQAEIKRLQSPANTGETQPVTTQTGRTESENTTDVFTQQLNKAGANVAQASRDKVTEEQRKLTDGLNDEIADINNNPWYSQGKRDMEINKVNQRYETKLNTLSNFAKYYDLKYQEAVETAKYMTGLVREDQQIAAQRAQDLRDTTFKLEQAGFANKLALDKFAEEKRQFNLEYTASQGGGSGNNESNLLSYADVYAATGKIPTGIPKGSFGSIAILAKEIPKAPGSIVNKITGVADTSIGSVEQQDYSRLNNILKNTQRLKELDAERWGGVVSGGLGKIFGSDDQSAYLAVRKSIIDDMQRMQSGAALTAEETAFYSDYLPGRFSESLFLGQDSLTKIANFENIMRNRLSERLDTNNLSMVGYSTVNLGGTNYVVGSTITQNGVSGRVNADGTITLIN